MDSFNFNKLILSVLLKFAWLLLDIEFVFEVMGSISEGIDAFDLGDALRALNLNPTVAFIEKLGGTKRRNEKKIKMDEFLPIYAQVKKEKDQGCYEDFVECLKLYDKEENGTMALAELQHALLSLGESWQWHPIAQFG